MLKGILKWEGYPKILLFCCKDFVNRYILFTFAPRVTTF